MTITFTDLGDKTEMTTHFAGYATDELAEQAQAGWAQQLGKLEQHLTNQGGRSRSANHHQ